MIYLHAVRRMVQIHLQHQRAWTPDQDRLVQVFVVAQASTRVRPQRADMAKYGIAPAV